MSKPYFPEKCGRGRQEHEIIGSVLFAVSSAQRRRALVVSTLAVVGQEACGVFALLQFAERVFVLARDEVDAGGAVAAVGRGMLHAMNVTGANAVIGVNSTDMSNMTDVNELWAPPEAPTQQSALASPARHAVVLGAVQLVASCLALYFVERIGRRVKKNISDSRYSFPNKCIIYGYYYMQIRVGVIFKAMVCSR